MANTKHRTHLPSYRHRYFQIVLIVLLALAIVAVVSYRYVIAQNHSISKQSALREQSVAIVNDAFMQLYQARQGLHDFLLTPTGEIETGLDTALGHLDDALARLVDQSDLLPEGDTRTIARTLQQNGGALRQMADEIVAIRHEPARWFPSAELIEQELQTNNSLFVAHLDALVNTLQAEATDQATGTTVMPDMFELQKAWLRMIDELRLIIANRFGVHADRPMRGIQARAQNISLYADKIKTLLKHLRDDTPEVRDDPVMNTQVGVLNEYAQAWQEGYAKLIKQLMADDWRADLVYLRDRIEPHLRVMQQRLDVLRVELRLQRSRQIDDLSFTSIGMANVLLAALALMLVFAIVGYISLDRLILRPILALADNLKGHADHARRVPPHPPAVSETRDLLDAFDEMRIQVAQREKELDHLAHHDTLTGLPNRAFFRRRLSQALSNTQSTRMLVGLLFLDLDRFKQINDSYGHAAGDSMLQEIARRLLSVFRQDDIVARLGGDEFAVLLENLHERDEMTRLANKALSAIERPYAFGDQLFYSGASIGIAVAPDDGTDPDRLIQLADAAMYASKQDEGSSYRYVSSEMPDHAAARHTLENELREAIRQHALELHFQPVVSLRTGELHCYEALLRWPHAEQGMLQPASFMDAMADAGLCSAISDWALDQIDGRQPTADSPVSINLSARLLHDESFANRLFDRINQGRPPPQRLILEITEDTLEKDLRAAERVLHELKRLGVRVALDDFGTGQASLSHLRRFPFDYIKIDQSFVQGIGKVANDEKLIRAVIGLAHALGMGVVAEGVENDAQRDFLDAENCDYIQGYLVGKPTVDGR
ncbi:MAG: EAL domain-containing protein [Chromatiaceae bacterium]|nr:EAL domain-containing protein [Chromatiaceae bacterium]MCP5422368.1 EAL domain-containing protein [Chromatiaceae bacterium]